MWGKGTISTLQQHSSVSNLSSPPPLLHLSFFDMPSIQTPALALLFGLMTSVHCVGMCGPIACCIQGLGKPSNTFSLSSLFYHLGRVFSYGCVGTLLGSIGAKPLQDFHKGSLSLLSWCFVLLFLGFALGLEKKIPRPAFLNRWIARLRLRALKLSASKGGLIMGLVTPFLPCGPLYTLFAACLLTGSSLAGAEFAIAFGIGTVPLLWMSQSGMLFLQKKLGTKALYFTQRVLAVLAALFIAKRLLFDPSPLLDVQKEALHPPITAPVEPSSYG